MLFTDALIVTAADLARVENNIPDIASVTGIDTADVIAFSQDEFAEYLINKMQSYSGYTPPYSTPFVASVALVSLMTQSSNRGRSTLSQVVVTDSEYPGKWSALKRLLVYETLVSFYRQASNRKDKDLWQEKFETYRSEVMRYFRPRFVKRGVGIVSRPLYCPGSYLEPGSGSWSAAANLSTTPGDTPDNTTPSFDVVITWVDQNYYQSAANKQNGESGPSAIATVRVVPANQIVVNITSLTAPNGTFRPSALANMRVAPMNATGWNVYAGPHGGTLTRQNASPIPYATKTYTLAATLDTTGEVVGFGQDAEQYVPMPDIAMRG